MRQIFLGILLTWGLISTPSTTLALESPMTGNWNRNLASVPTEENFYPRASNLLQQQLYLIVRIESAPDQSRPQSNPRCEGAIIYSD